MKFGRNPKRKLRGGGHFVCHLSYRSSDKPAFELEREFDKSNSYMKFGRNPIKND